MTAQSKAQSNRSPYNNHKASETDTKFAKRGPGFDFSISIDVPFSPSKHWSIHYCPKCIIFCFYCSARKPTLWFEQIHLHTNHQYIPFFVESITENTDAGCRPNIIFPYCNYATRNRILWHKLEIALLIYPMQTSDGAITSFD